MIPGLGRSPGEGNGNPLQYSCLENSMDGGAWWATVQGVTKSQTRLSKFTSLKDLRNLLRCLDLTRGISNKDKIFVIIFALDFLCSKTGTCKCFSGKNPESKYLRLCSSMILSQPLTSAIVVQEQVTDNTLTDRCVCVPINLY